VTPKGAVRAKHVPFWYIAPYVLLSLLSSLTVWLVSEPGSAAGFYVFCLMTALFYGGLVVLVIVRHARENGLRLFPGTVSGIATAVSIAAMAGGLAAAAHENGTRGLAAINLGVTALTLTDTVYPPSGAGRASQAMVRLRPKWHGV
jgi:cellulose synthase (UDP-forming)